MVDGIISCYWRETIILGLSLMCCQKLHLTIDIPGPLIAVYSFCFILLWCIHLMNCFGKAKDIPLGDKMLVIAIGSNGRWYYQLQLEGYYHTGTHADVVPEVTQVSCSSKGVTVSNKINFVLSCIIL